MGEPVALGAGTVLALRTGVATWLAMVAAGVVMAAITRDTWILGFLGYGESLAVEIARQSLAVIYARFAIEGDSFLHGLHLLALAPLLAALVTARRLRPSVAGLAPPARAAWALAATVPFLALCTPLVALAESGPVDVNGRSVLFYALLLTGGGALAGVFGLPGRTGAVLRAALAPLGVAIVVLSAVATLLVGGLILTNQVPRIGYDIEDIPPGTPEPALLQLDAGSAFLQNAITVLNYGPAYASAGLLAEAKGDAVFPITDARYQRLTQGEKERYIRCLFRTECGEEVRVFDGARDLPPLLFLPILWIILLVPWAAAIIAGYSVARLQDATTAARAMLWGALTGPLWSVALTFLEAIGSSGSVDVPSTFYWSLLTATILGAVGGRLALRGAEPSNR